MPIGQTRPLHRLTQLQRDPVAAWLSSRQRFRVTVAGWMAWGGFGFSLLLLRMVLTIVLIQIFHYSGRLPSAISVMVAVALASPVRREILRMKSQRAATIARGNAGDAQAVHAVDDLTDLDREPDGSVVSVVGWIRGRLDVEYLVRGKPCIGLALPCQEKFPGILETLHDFELADEGGNVIAIRVAGGRMLGRPNVLLDGSRDHRHLIASLDLPSGAVPAGMGALVLRDGDPVMIVGFKHTITDPDWHATHQTAIRPALGSSPQRPLLIFPLVAERQAA